MAIFVREPFLFHIRVRLLISLATSDSYNTCDLGTFPNQTLKTVSRPAASLHSGPPKAGHNTELSWLPGQRVRLASSHSFITYSSGLSPSSAPALVQAQTIPDPLSLKAVVHPRLTSWKQRRTEKPPARSSPRVASLRLSLMTTFLATLRPTNSRSTPLRSQEQIHIAATLSTYLIFFVFSYH